MRSRRIGSLGLGATFVLSWLLLAGAVSAQGPAPPPGPPYPPPIFDVVVYDHADLLSPEYRAAATRIIVEIERRTGAEIVIYTQYKPGSTTETTEYDARMLIEQWGVGRAGFDDGLAILVNMNRRNCQPGVSGNGQIQLYAAPGYQATYLDNAARQRIFEQDMLPHLRECDFDVGILVGLQRIDAATTPQNARRLELARQANAFIGLVVAPLLFLLLVGIAGQSWLRYGKDPVYLDSPSILMPAPPAGMTAASGAVIWEGQATRRALTTALLDLASRGEFSFRPEGGIVRDKMGIEMLAAPPNDPYVVRNRRRPLSGAEEQLLREISVLAPHSDALLTSTQLEGLATKVGSFNKRLEQHVSALGWFREPPQEAIRRWTRYGALALVAAVIVFFVADEIPMSGLTFVALAVAAAGIVMVWIARHMPARTMTGAMMYAMLAAYRRTLQKTMAQARSMIDVVREAHLDWLETPDQAVVWGVALGLHADVERVLARSAEDARRGRGESAWVPAWYGGSYGSSSAALGGGGGSRGMAPGLFSTSAVPSFGGMVAALGTIGVSSSSSSSGGSGGFSGGGGGGGGGGSGGGF